METPPLPREARLPLLLYRLAYPLLFLLALPYYLLRMRRRERGRADRAKPPGYHLGLGQRFGFYKKAERAWFKQGAPIWLHSISVGETFVALKLAHQIRKARPNARVVISTTTSTGFEIALDAAKHCHWLQPIYNPIDLRGSARRALKAIQPSQLVLIEGEIWPNLITLARQRGLRVVLANARLSPRSERRYRKFIGWTGPIFRLLDHVFVQEEADLARFESIGVRREQLTHVGSIKFDNASSHAPSRLEEFRKLLAPLGFHPDTPILLGGSTWAPEEKALAETLCALRTEFTDLRLIVVPRHVERAEAVHKELAARGLRVARRSALASVGQSDVLVVDSTGELRDWYSFATVVFVGKSLPGIAEVGGQNAGEPAALGQPVVFGPHMENFDPLVKLLLGRGAAIRVPDASALTRTVAKLLREPSLRQQIGEAARVALEIHQGATARTVERL